MKRKTVTVDEELLEKARQVTGERTNSAVVDTALTELLQRVDRLQRAIERFRATPDFFWPDYLETIRPNSWAAQERRAAANGPATRHNVKRVRNSR
ncbi:MAG TPA: type II toxin-antitoxin system VapB family antitoxin [Thermoanaerobaculia bacterium]|nr:type II toxin-antitoxin system VapB family antitoxin [Thermoanaerobaculia bacterium]